MVDIVTVNEFAFTPSAFIAAYIEEIKTDFSVTEVTANSGNLSTVPNSVGTVDTSLANALIAANANVSTAGKISALIPSIAGSSNSDDLTSVPVAGGSAVVTSSVPVQGVPGAVAVASPGSGPTTTITGSVLDFLGQEVTDTRTVTKTTTASSRWAVVLILSYGTYKSHVVDRASGLATINQIYTQVNAYLQSL